MWRARFMWDVDKKNGLVCNANILETIALRFGDCQSAQRAWDFSIGIANNMEARPGQKEHWKHLDWQHGIFRKSFPFLLVKCQGFGF
jgi:hypothetical protein